MARAHLREDMCGSQWRVGDSWPQWRVAGGEGAASVSRLPPASPSLAPAWSCDPASCHQAPSVAAGCTRDCESGSPAPFQMGSWAPRVGPGLVPSPSPRSILRGQLRRMAGGGRCFWMQRTFQAFPARLCLGVPAQGLTNQAWVAAPPHPAPPLPTPLLPAHTSRGHFFRVHPWQRTGSCP